MEALLALASGALYAAGIYLMLRRRLAQLIIGLGLLSNGTNLLIFTAGGLTRARPPVVPPPLDEGPDPEEALRERLLLYRRFRDAGGNLRARLELGWQLFHREAPVAIAAGKAGARPVDGPPLDVALLAVGAGQAMVHHGGVHEAGRDAVAADALPRELERDRARERHHPALGRVVARVGDAGPTVRRD